jgi:carbonic anhydrase/acetyltransferase-like protein (isoleucine patch superfamily)
VVSYAYIAIGATVLHGALIQTGAIVAVGALVYANTLIPPGFSFLPIALPSGIRSEFLVRMRKKLS